jgi:hypothetical protein
LATYDPAPERLIRKVDELLKAAEEADTEIDDAFNVLYALDGEKKWDGYIIGSDSPLVIAAASVSWLREELDRLAMDLRTIGIEP